VEQEIDAHNSTNIAFTVSKAKSKRRSLPRRMHRFSKRRDVKVNADDGADFEI
jgi:hypothetical protein